jgi:HK97 gp10 family phage protein
MAYVPNNRGFQLEGFAEFEQQLLQLAEMGRADLTARRTLVKALRAAMQPVYQYVVDNAPYDESNKGPIHMRDTARIDARIPVERDQRSEYINPTDAAIAIVSVKQSAVSLANEFGTSKMDAQPFLRPALDSNASRVLANVSQELANFIPAHARRLNRKRK